MHCCHLCRFGATYVGSKQLSPTETFPVLVGDIDPTGNLNANIIHQFTERIRGKLATQVQRSKFSAVQMTADYRGDTYSLSLTLGNPDVLSNSGNSCKSILLLIFWILKFLQPKFSIAAFRTDGLALPPKCNIKISSGWRVDLPARPCSSQWIHFNCVFSWSLHKWRFNH